MGCSKMNDQNKTVKANAYVAPTLVVYGAMTELTASGSTSSGENMGAMAMNMA